MIDWDAVAEGADPEEAKTTKLNKIPFNRNTVKKWRLKEEWFFDKQRSVMDVRIIGLAPLQEDRDEVNGQLLAPRRQQLYYHKHQMLLFET